MTIKINGDNTVANPGFSGNDTDTGLQVGTNELKLVTGGSEAVTVDSSQNVGVGTSSPSNTLHLRDDSTSNVDILYLQNRNGGASSGARIAFSNGTVDYSDDRYAYIGAVNTGASENGNSLVFATNATGASPSENMRIDSSGNVGIGTTTPTDKLNISSGSNQIALDTGDQTAYGTLDLGHFANGAFIGTVAGSNATSNILRLGTSGIERMRIDSTGNIILGDATPTQIVAGTNSGKFYQASDSNFISCRATTASATHQSFFNSNGGVGSITTSSTSTNYNTSSDYRLKENVVDLDGAIDRVKQLAPKRFNFIADAERTVDGFLAHEAQAVVPEAITGTHNEVDENGDPVYQGIDQSKLVPLLTAALQEAISKIETLETQNADLLARVTALENA